MRLITFILSSGIALACIPASASAQSNTFGHSVSTLPCPKHEGYPDCSHDGVARSSTPAYANRSAPRHRAYGSLWRASRARQPR
jgi:hypothetical protein